MLIFFKKPWLTGILVTIAATFVGCRRSYGCWQRRKLKQLQSDSSIDETAVGPVEYQVSGKGPAVIYAHGSPGGYDQGRSFAQFIGDEYCMMISPSRPGYLRTPLASGASPEEQADLYAALLDALGIAKASVIGFSGGGPSALQFALRHADRCHSLVMIGGLVRRTCVQEKKQALPPVKRLFTNIVEYLLVSDPFLYLILPITRLLPSGKAVVGMLDSGALYHLRKAGYENDIVQFAAMQSYPLEQITAPTLVVHGTLDEDVPLDDAKLLARLVPNAKLLALRGGHESFYTHARTMIPMVRDFLAL